MIVKNLAKICLVTYRLLATVCVIGMLVVTAIFSVWLFVNGVHSTYAVAVKTFCATITMILGLALVLLYSLWIIGECKKELGRT